MFARELSLTGICICLLWAGAANGQDARLLRPAPTTQKPGNAFKMAFSPDGQLLAIAVGTVTTDPIEIWHVSKAKLVATLPRPADLTTTLVSTLQWLDNTKLVGVTVAIAGEEKGSTVVIGWDLPSRAIKVTSVLRGGGGVLAISPDGRLVVTNGPDDYKTAKVWDWDANKQIAGLQCAKGVTRAVVSADSKILVTASWDKMIKVWDLATFKEKMTIEAYDDVEQLFVSPKGDVVTFYCRPTAKRRGVEVWDIAGEKPRLVHEGLRLYKDQAMSADGRWLANIATSEIEFWDLRRGTVAVTIPEKLVVDLMVFSPDGKSLALRREGAVVVIAVPPDVQTKGVEK